MEHHSEASRPYLSYGVAFGMFAGAALGLMFLDNIAFGAAVGLVFGITLGISLDAKNNDGEEPI